MATSANYSARELRRALEHRRGPVSQRDWEFCRPRHSEPYDAYDLGEVAERHLEAPDFAASLREASGSITAALGVSGARLLADFIGLGTSLGWVAGDKRTNARAAFRAIPDDEVRGVGRLVFVHAAALRIASSMDVRPEYVVGLILAGSDGRPLELNSPLAAGLSEFFGSPAAFLAAKGTRASRPLLPSALALSQIDSEAQLEVWRQHGRRPTWLERWEYHEAHSERSQSFENYDGYKKAVQRARRRLAEFRRRFSPLLERDTIQP